MAEGEYRRLSVGVHLPKTDKMASHCEAPGCERVARSRWRHGISLCAMHYLRMLNKGDLGPLPPPPDGVCVVDDCSRATRSKKAQHCEMHYYRMRRNGSLETLVDVAVYADCRHCGKPTASGRKYCSPRCSTRASRGLAPLMPCLACGKPFESVDGWRCCSTACKAKHRRAQARLWYAANAADPVQKAKIRSREYRRKARKLDAFVENVDRDAVMRRDKWVCHLCKGVIPKDAKWPSGLFGTLDHVVPLAAGGLHSYDNIKAAHLSCNCSKGARTIGQLGLMLVERPEIEAPEPVERAAGVPGPGGG